MLESLITLLDKFTPEILVILSGLLVITTTLFLWLWFANRRTYNLLRHQLPASVVKQYLDTVIQNSNTLKNALFRGGVDGLDPMSLPQGQPAPVNTEQLAQFISKSNPQTLVSGGDDSELRAQLNQKISELAALQSQLSSAQSAKRELESSYAGAQARIIELEALLAQAGKSGGADPALAAELEKIKKERNEFQNKLKEYEIIEDDLANLKRLQQENQQLKRALAEASGGSVPDSIAPATIESGAKVTPPEDLFDEVSESLAAQPQAEEPSEDKVTEDLEQFLGGSEPQPTEEASEETEEHPAVAAAAAEDTKAKAPEKSPEDLLSEFEKMLG